MITMTVERYTQDDASPVERVVDDVDLRVALREIAERRHDDSTTLTLVDAGRDRQLIVAVSNDRFFVGLIEQRRQAQLTRPPPTAGSVEMTIGGQATTVDGRYAVGFVELERALRGFLVDDPVDGVVWTTV